MAYPTKYTRQYGFQAYQDATPNRPLPGDKVDFDLNAVEDSIDTIVEFLKLHSRSDGALLNGVVTVESLSPEVAAALGVAGAIEAEGIAFTPTGGIAATNVQDAIEEVAGLIVTPEAGDIPFTPAGNIAASNVQAAIQELDTEKSSTSHAHAASAITYSAGGTIAATTVQTAIEELDAEKQAKDQTLTAWAAITFAADKIGYATGDDNFATTDFTAYGRSIVGVADEAALHTLVNLEIGTDVQAFSDLLAGIAALTINTGDLVYGQGVGGVAVLNPGSDGQFLKLAGGVPVWDTVAGGGDLLSTNNLSDVADAPTAFDTIKQAATDAYTGVVEIASDAEAQAKAATDKALVASNLAALAATDAFAGFIELATNTEAQAKSATDRAVTPGNLGSMGATDSFAGFVELATNAEAQAKSDTTRAVTPGNLGSMGATDSFAGFVELATNAEAQAKSDTTRAVTPGNLGSMGASTSFAGFVELATNAEAQAKSSTTHALTPANLASIGASTEFAGLVELATVGETQAGTDTARAVTPGRQHAHPSAVKFWVKAGVTGNILASYNVTSVADNGVGSATISIGTDFASGNWCAIATANAGAVRWCRVDSQAAGSVRVVTHNSAQTLADPDFHNVCGMGGQ